VSPEQALEANFDALTTKVNKLLHIISPPYSVEWLFTVPLKP